MIKVLYLLNHAGKAGQGMQVHAHLAFVTATVVSAGSVFAANLYDWAGDPAGTVQVVTDPSGDQAEGSRDILSLWTAWDASNYYFRLDIRTAPEQEAGRFAAEYGVHIDLAPGGGDSSLASYIADGVTGIDTIVLSHYTVANGWTSNHRHNYLGDLAPAPRVDTVMLEDVGGQVDFSENGGTTLQWAIPKAALDGTPFVVYGATQNISVPITFDLTAPLVVPEPATLALLALGGLVGLRRRRA